MNVKATCIEWAVLSAGMVLAAAAETNAVCHFDRLFILPEPQLRLFSTSAPSLFTPAKRDSLTESPPATTKMPPKEVRGTGAFVLSITDDNDDFPSHGFTQHELAEFPPLRSTEGFGTRFLESVFTPEEFHLGKTKVSCSLFTAIKRKNPLCLINPIILNVSW